jgi:hypothetical protein
MTIFLNKGGKRKNAEDELQNGVFEGLSSLATLSISNFGFFVRIHSGTFKHLDGLRALTLSRTGVSQIEKNSFSSMSQLEQLILMNNKLARYDDGAFNGLVNLQTLYLANNPLRSISSGLFSDLVNLRSLDLTGTELESPISKEAFSHCKHEIRVSSSAVPKSQQQQAGSVGYYFAALARITIYNSKETPPVPTPDSNNKTEASSGSRSDSSDSTKESGEKPPQYSGRTMQTCKKSTAGMRGPFFKRYRVAIVHNNDAYS